MKKISTLKLNQFSKAELEKHELNNLRGGGDPVCGCYYYGSGGQSHAANQAANEAGGYHSCSNTCGFCNCPCTTQDFNNETDGVGDQDYNANGQASTVN